MASQQEAERVIRELTGEYKLEENVYESGRRFLRELLLYINARYFIKALKRSEDPYISFKIHSSHIDVDFNDDGFTKADLEHLCIPSATVQKGTIRYGLDCVFKSTAKIYIRSVNFSLDMRLTTSEGKIRPTWVSPLTSVLDTRTHMAIHFHDNGTEEDVKRLKHVILSQFESLKAESLLFVERLWRISVEFYDKGGELRSSKQFQKLFRGADRVLLKSAINNQGEGREESQLYHITDQETDSRRHVTLAFPLTEEGKPLISVGKKDIFNVLPCGTSEYSFLIDGDFKVNCKQQDFEPSSPRNKSIEIWIAAALLQAVSKFCNDPGLCYEWPLFLPSIGDKTPLSLEIRHMVQKSLLVKVYNQPALRCMNEITLLPDYFQDENGQPLLASSAENMLLSPDYPKRVVHIFKEHGAKTLDDEKLLLLLKDDMRNQKPKMHQKDTTEEWQARMARFLLQFSKSSTFNALRVKSDAIMPLKGGTWTSMLFGPVHFPHTGVISIPDSIHLRVVAPHATQNPDRYALFKYLGVTEPSLDTARRSVVNSLIASDTLPLELANSYLRYLYLTHEASGWTRDDYEEVIVFTTDSTTERPQSNEETIYLPGKGHPFSPESLLGLIKSESSLPCSFLHPETLSYVSTQGSPLNISWRRWLCDYIGVSEEICLKSPSTGSLSPEFLHIVVQSPHKLLDLLEHLISKGEVDLSSESAIISEIRQLSASNLCNVGFTIQLQETWLPLKTLTDIVETYMEQPDQFPFLRSIQDDTGSIDTKWNFLSEHLLLTASGEMTADREKLRNFFDESGIVYFNGEELEWTSSSSCLWDGPPEMITMRSLKSCYDLQGSNVEVRSALQSLFVETLGIQNAKLEHLVAELNELRIKNDEDPAKILRIYEFLNTNTPSSQDMSRSLFESSPFIFIPHGPYTGWHTSTEVLWSSNTELCGMGTLDDTYGSLRDFCVDKLGLESLSLRILYDRLIKSPKCEPQQMKEAIFILNDFLRSEPAFLDPQPVRDAEIFPIRKPDGTVTLKSVETDFAIEDNHNLRISFEKHISLIDFDLREFHRLKPFFRWLKLESRYLSRCVREDVRVVTGRGGFFVPPTVPIPYKKRNLKAMARYITRFAANFDSPYCRSGIKAFHKHLCRIECVQALEIVTWFSLQQNGETFVPDSQLSKAHIAEPDGRLTIYVPMDPASQDVCFRSVLPRKFATWIMQDPESSDRPHVDIEMVNALTAILASETTSLDEILDELGIARISYDGLSDDEDEATRQKVSFKNVVERPRKADSLSFGIPVTNTRLGF
ncbi:hypothetical protein FNYG_08461 [Fusarium nygamai]|uniref:Uncharacterized protein n=1 Tax=Gibberella nygamai TaxID=42673 RepID=A0A2K0W7B7_GIBNY|nr:hypothetical protein FNYG_08461 [Fusarium nygamai]